MSSSHVDCMFPTDNIRESKVLGPKKVLEPKNPKYSTSGQNGTWGQNGTPGVLKKACLGWVYFQLHLIAVVGQFSATRRNQTCNRPRFEYLTKT